MLNKIIVIGNLGADPAAGATGLNPTAISGLVDATIADADYVMFWDAQIQR